MEVGDSGADHAVRWSSSVFLLIECKRWDLRMSQMAFNNLVEAGVLIFTYCALFFGFKNVLLINVFRNDL